MCVVGGVVTIGHAQEFPEDELVEEQIVIIPFRTGLINRGKVRQIYRHTERVITGWERQPKYGERSHLYTYLPHPVVKFPVVQVQRQVEEKYRVLPQVGVKLSSSHSKPRHKPRGSRQR